jgi:hypothetical protein
MVVSNQIILDRAVLQLYVSLDTQYLMSERPKSERAQLPLLCTVEEANEVRRRANDNYQTVSGYVLRVVMRVVQMDQRLAEILPTQFATTFFRGRNNWRGTEERTRLLLRCSSNEARLIRKAAKLRHMTVCAYVFAAMRRLWQITEQIKKS